MKANESNLLKFLNGRKQFIIPIYQRMYRWTLKECRQLWDDICVAAKDELVKGHFIGSIVYTGDDIYQITSVPRLIVIDGQQRLATIFLLLSVLGNILDERNENTEITLKKINNYYIFNNEETGEARYKLLLTQKDKDTLNCLIENKELENASQNIINNYNFFKDQVRKYDDLNRLYNGIGKLIVVDISLDRNADNPQLIFESLNSKGLDLSQTDLIRNYILLKLDKDKQDELYNNYWHKMENIFINSDSPDIFDRFIRDYLTIKTGHICNLDQIYSSFKRYVQKKQEPIEYIVSDIYLYAKYYMKFAFLKENDEELCKLFKSIKTLKVDVVYPFLLELYNDYEQNELLYKDFLEFLKYIESYVFRRAICDIPTNSLNKTFATIRREIDRNNYLEDFKKVLLIKDSYRRFPRNKEFCEKFVLKDIYNFRNCDYLLGKIENFKRKEEVVVANYTVEHIMPQNKNLSFEWRKELGDGWKETQATYLHTIGNLTITGYNSELSDKPFIEKCNMEGGFADSPFKLNRSLAKLEHWNEEEILRRANKLAELAVEIWPSPENDFLEPLPCINTKEIISNVFPSDKYFIAAQLLVRQITDIAEYDKIKHVLSFTYRNKKMITINLGQWLILRFERIKNSVEITFCVDFDLLNEVDFVDSYKKWFFRDRWAKERNFGGIYFLWDQDVNFPDTFLKAWHTAVLHTYDTFSTRTSSSYMKYNCPELIPVFLEENNK